MRLFYRSVAVVFGLFGSGTVLLGQEAELPTVVVEGKAESLIGIAPSASKGQASREELMARPLSRRGELLETIPGVIITQHAGDGKANQYFVRGSNLDHGTDFAMFVDGMPVNFRNHAHGQGYADLNFIIPEMGFEFERGGAVSDGG
jgi:outer membrane receptor for Fe3+-dicitrate